jgi:hypothetical protein
MVWVTRTRIDSTRRQSMEWWICLPYGRTVQYRLKFLTVQIRCKALSDFKCVEVVTTFTRTQTTQTSGREAHKCGFTMHTVESV